MRMSAVGPLSGMAPAAGCRAATAGRVRGRPGLGAQQLGQAWHFGEAAGVVGAGDGSGSGPAGRSGSDVAAGAGVELDFVGVTDGFGRVGSWIMGGLAGLRKIDHPRMVSQTFLRSGRFSYLSENEF